MNERVPFADRVRARRVGRGRLREIAVMSSLMALAVGLAWLAWAAGSGLSWLDALDWAIAAVFVFAAVGSRGQIAHRLWYAAVSATWLFGAIPELRPLHQAVLLAALAVFPQGWVRRPHPWQWLVLFLALPLAFGLFGQAWAGMVFLVCALGAAGAARRRAGGWYPPLAAAGVGATLLLSWTWSRLRPQSFDPIEALIAYELVLLVVAVTYPLGMAGERRRRATLADRLLADVPDSGLAGLETVLRGALRDPGLRIALATHPSPARDAGHVLDVMDDGVLIATVTGRRAGLDDPATAEAVVTSVRLAVRHELLLAELAARQADLEATRTRILESADRQRMEAADELRDDLILLARTGDDIDRLKAFDDDERLVLIAGEVTAATVEIEGIVAGVPPFDLGGGRLAEALATLARRSPLPTSVRTTPDSMGDADTETALFYACTEALANVAKHARASSIEVILHPEGDELVLSITDDGSGGADPTGSGLLGIGDRLAACGGRLRVQSHPGAGTTVIAMVPISRSSATA